MMYEARFIRQISIALNAIQAIDKKTAYLIIFCLNCIQCDRISTYKIGLRVHDSPKVLSLSKCDRGNVYLLNILVKWQSRATAGGKLFQ